MINPKSIRWINQQLKEQNLTLNAPAKQIHKRAWSMVTRVPTNSGDLYFKATEPALRYEVRLTAVLSQMGFPVPDIVAVDEAEGWILMHDSGQPLRSILQETRDISLWETAVTQYAHMQIELIDHTETILQTGLFDRRLATLPKQYETLLQDRNAMLIGKENGLTESAYHKLMDAVPSYTMMCQQLGNFGIPETLHHDDFHDNNIFVKEDQFTFADWGEACLTHPFFSMIIVLRIAEYILKLAKTDHSLTRLKDAYLNQWRDFGTTAQLQDAFDLAQIVGTVNRALTWHTMLTFMEEAERAEEADSVPGWLQEFLESANAR